MSAPRIEKTERGPTVIAGGRYLYSSRNPEGRPQRIALQAPCSERCIYFVPSPLLGYGLNELLERIPDSSVILAVETSQELMALCSPHIPDSLRDSPKLRILRLSDRTGLHAVLRDIGHWNFRRVHRVDLSGGTALDAGTYDDLYDFIAEDLTVYWRNRHALGRLGREWVRHSLANLADLGRSNRDYRSLQSLSPVGVPVIVGAGPSLDQAFGFMNAVREKIWICAADTAAPSLLENGIRPDAVLILETQSWNMLDFHGLQNSGIPVIADITAYPPSLSTTGGPIYLFSSDFADLDYLRRLDRAGLRSFSIPPLGSVGIAAIEIAVRTTDSPIILTGLDFAYLPGISHARGSSVHRWQLGCNRRTNPYPGWEASMRRPRRKSRSASSKSLETDAILAGYAASLTDRYAGCGRLSVLAPGGLDLSLPILSPDQAQELVNSHASGPSGLSPAVKTPADGSNLSGAATDFLSEERDRFAEVVRRWDSYALEDGSSVEVKRSLEGLDEVFCDFPDEPPLPRDDDSFLVRAVSRCRKLLRYLDRQSAPQA